MTSPDATITAGISGMQPRRPNVLFLMMDEHRPDVTGYEGNAVVRTPTLDWLARTGVVFRNAYTPSPICIPGRQSNMAGQLPMTTGCLQYGQDLEPGYRTFSRLFSRYAYATVACGKLHHMGTDQMQGWTTRIAGDTTVGQRYIPDTVDDEFARYVRPGSAPLSAAKWSDAKEIQRAGVGRGPTVVKDEYTARGACDFIQEYFASPAYDRDRRDTPLMLKVSLVQPHYPYTTDEARFTHYLNRVPLFLDQPVSPHPILSRRAVRPGVDVSEREVRRAVAAYYGMIETADAHFRAVLDALDAVGENLDDWIVVYTADHGEMLGEHGVWEKQKFYEASVRVPLIIRWPAGLTHAVGPTEPSPGPHVPRDPHVVQENVNTCDLFATLCELAGIPVPAALDSRSLVPFLSGHTGAADNWRQRYRNETVSHFGRTHLLIKWDALKYQYYGEELPEVLFDLERDPTEVQDYITDPTYAEILSAFRRRRAALGYGPDADPGYINAGYGN